MLTQGSSNPTEVVLVKSLAAFIPWGVFMGMMLMSSAAHAADVTLHVVGNRLKTADGRAVRLQGVNVPSLEWSNTGESVLRSIQVAMDEWKANSIRLPLAQDRWFGHASGQRDGGKAYREIVDNAVQAVAERGGYIILDLHWSDAGEWGKQIAQHRMPDQNSLSFWKDAATRYANHPAVLFDLYNEPHDVSWEVWLHGGTVAESKMPSYESPGMQGLLDAVRKVGARNVVVASGLDWGYDLRGIAQGYALQDPDGNGVIYASHIYPWKGNTRANWGPRVTVIADRHPILIGEVGCEPDPKQQDPHIWAPNVLAYIDDLQLNWTAWTFHPSATPRMITGWDYAPTPFWGVYVKKALAAAGE